MGSRYIFELSDGPSQNYHFAYFDTDDHLAGFLFAQENVDITVEGEFGAEDDPYRIIMCEVPQKQRDQFLQCVGMLPDLMAYVGKTDYDDFCINFMMNAARFKNRNEAGRGIPLQ